MEGLLFIAIVVIVFCVLTKPIRRKFKKHHKKASRREYVKADTTGKRGERLIYNKLIQYERHGAQFLFNLYIPKKDGNTTEIDDIMITTRGIFVFESKDYSGWIFGEEHRAKWCQVLPVNDKHSNKEYFYNPVMQNKIHINALKNLLGDTVPMFSLVVFSDRCTFKGTPSVDCIRGVVKVNKLKLAVDDIYNVNTDVLTEEDIHRIYDLLYPYTIVDSTTKINHINNIRNTHQQNPKSPQVTSLEPVHKDSILLPKIEKEIIQAPTSEEQIPEADTEIEKEIIITEDAPQVEEIQPKDERMCPRCGKKLIKRKATWGEYNGKEFLGCTGYPNCKYIENVADNCDLLK